MGKTADHRNISIITINNKKGISIVEVLVSSAIAAIVALAMSSMIVNQNKEMKAMTEKMAALDVERILITSLTNGTLCTAELTNPLLNPAAPYILNTTPAALPNQSFSLQKIHSSIAVASPSLIQVRG